MSNLRLKCISRFPRNFSRNGILITTYYQRWTILDEQGKFIRFWDITEESYLSSFLSNLLGHREELPITEQQMAIFETVFSHTNKWSLFKEAIKILNSKGSKKALKYLEDKFAIIRLGDKLNG